MNKRVAWRMDFARTIAKVFEGLKGVQATAIGGSLARGYADEYSDVEILVCWESMPEQAAQKAFMSVLKNTFSSVCRDTRVQHTNCFLIDGVAVTLMYTTLKNVEAAVDAVLIDNKPDLDSNTYLEIIHSCIPIFGDALVQKLKQRIRNYSEELAIAIIQGYLPSLAANVEDLAIMAQRDNPAWFYRIMSAVQVDLFMILLALNRTYCPTPKWMYRSLEELPIKPKNLVQRLKWTFQGSSKKAFSDIKQILSEVLPLIDRQFPQLSTVSLSLRLPKIPVKYTSPKQEPTHE